MPNRPARRDRPVRDRPARPGPPRPRPGTPRSGAARRGAARSGAARPLPALALSAAALLGSLSAPGCATLRQKWDAAIATDIDNPTVPPKPIRVPGAVASADPGPAGPPPDVRLAGGSDDGTVRVASADAAFPPAGVSPAAPPHFDDSDVVATINGEPLLAGDLLQFEVQIKNAAARIAAAPSPEDLPPGDPRGLTDAQRATLMAQVDAARVKLLAERLPAKIEEALLAQRMRGTLKAEQLDKLNDMVATLFDQSELPEMIAKANAQALAAGRPPVEDKAALRRLMQEQGLDLDAVVAAWKPQQMAMAYVEQKTGMGSIRVSRQEVRDYYDAHRAEFTPPEGVRFEQIVIPYADDEAKSAVLDVVEVAAGDLRRGRAFAAVAKDYSRGPNAVEGGRWDWTAPGAVPDERIARAVWEQPVGEIGAVIDCPLSPDGFPPGGAYKIVRVLERRGAEPTPLEDLRERIETMIKSERRQSTVSALLAEERAAAQIEVYVPGTRWPPEN